MVDVAFRSAWGPLVAALVRTTRDLDLAEDAAAAAFVAALDQWPRDGVPHNVHGWLLRVARNKALDASRRDARLQRDPALLEALATEPVEDASPIADDQLRLVFTCCHPALAPEAQVALTLREVVGLTSPEIARAFLLPVATLQQRLVRAKRKIREARIPFEVPGPETLGERVEAVLAVLYTVFTEGYAATEGARVVRGELCDEAVRLTRSLRALLPPHGEVDGLLALMLLHDSRREARVDPLGRLVRLDEQDRGAWRRDRIAEGTSLVEGALRARPVGPYAVHAAIAALHAAAPRAEDTDWPQIAVLYRALAALDPAPGVRVSLAVAVAMAGDPAGAEAVLDEVAQEAEAYAPYHLARAEVWERLGRLTEALGALGRGIALTTNEAERAHLTERLARLRVAASAGGR